MNGGRGGVGRAGVVCVAGAAAVLMLVGAAAGLVPRWVPAEPSTVAVPAEESAAKTTAGERRAPGAVAAWPMALLGTDGTVRAADVAMIRLTDGRGSITVVEGGQSRVVEVTGNVGGAGAVGSVAAVVPAAWAAEVGGVGGGASIGGSAASVSSGAMVLHLNDGQRLPGRFAEAAAEVGGGGRAVADAVLWEHARFGVIAVALDDVYAWERGGTDTAAGNAGAAAAGAGESDTQDVVYLANGDVLRGVIEALGEEIVLGGERAADGTRRLAARDVVRAELANPERAPAGMGLWLSDGSVVSVASVASESAGGRLKVRLSGRSPEGEDSRGEMGGASAEKFVVPGEVLGLALDRGAMMGLSGLSVVDVEPIAPRLFASGPELLGVDGRAERGAGGVGAGDVFALGAAGVRLTGPARFVFAVPGTPRRVRISGVVELPIESRVWGACEVVVERVGAGDGGAAVEVARVKLSGNEPAARVNAATEWAAGARLRISVEPGVRGPVHNRVLLRNVVVQTTGR